MHAEVTRILIHLVSRCQSRSIYASVHIVELCILWNGSFAMAFCDLDGGILLLTFLEIYLTPDIVDC